MEVFLFIILTLLVFLTCFMPFSQQAQPPDCSMCVAADRIHTALLGVQGWVPASFHRGEHFLASCEAPERCNTAKNIIFEA